MKILLVNNKLLRLEFWRAVTKSTSLIYNDTEMIHIAVRDIQNSGPFIQRYVSCLLMEK